MAKSRASPVAALDRSPSHLLHRVLQLALDIYGEEAGLDPLTQRQYAVLCAVSADEGLSQTGLVRATGIDRSTLADVVARMIGKDLLVRERSAADARANTVRLTAQGRAALEAASPRVHTADHRLLSLLGAKKRDAFIDALRRLSKAGEAVLTPPEDLKVDDEAAERRAANDEAKPAKPKKHGKHGKKKRRREAEAVEGAEPPIP